jgi:hypothetical protein
MPLIAKTIMFNPFWVDIAEYIIYEGDRQFVVTDGVSVYDPASMKERLSFGHNTLTAVKTWGEPQPLVVTMGIAEVEPRAQDEYLTNRSYLLDRLIFEDYAAGALKVKTIMDNTIYMWEYDGVIILRQVGLNSNSVQHTVIPSTTMLMEWLARSYDQTSM